jgi:hypothetical protein
MNQKADFRLAINNLHFASCILQYDSFLRDLCASVVNPIIYRSNVALRSAVAIPGG